MMEYGDALILMDKTLMDSIKNELSYTIEVKLHTGSSKRGIQFRDDGAHIYTTCKPVQGKANQDAVKILSDYFHIPKRSVSLIRGAKSRHKVFLLQGHPVIDKKDLHYVREA